MDTPLPPAAFAQNRAVAVIGAGFTGTITALNLLRSLGPDRPVLLCERAGRFGCGVAYGTPHDDHLLNVRAARMSAFPEEPDHFEAWLRRHAADDAQRVHRTPAGVFATRAVYGQYLSGMLDAAMAPARGRPRLHLVADEVIGIAPAAEGWRLSFAEGRPQHVGAVVLAIGNLRSRETPAQTVRSDPWADSALHGLRSGLPVLLIGTGLTAMDLAMSLHGIGLAGPVLALSRRGLVPQPHAPAAAWRCPGFTETGPLPLRSLVRALRREVACAAQAGVDWRAVIDALRPQTQALWRGLPMADRARFLRHLRPYWDVHRHRLAPPVAARIEAMRASGYLRVLRGRLRGVEADGAALHATIQHRGGGTERIAVQRIINATGLASAADCPDTLLRSLLADGLARLDGLGLGIDVSGALRVIGASGCEMPNLWALGPIVRGVFWECVAVPDIRVQAARVAAEMAAAPPFPAIASGRRLLQDGEG